MCQRIRDLPSENPQAKLMSLALRGLPKLNVHLRSINIHLHTHINVDSIIANVPNIRCLKITGSKFYRHLDFSFLRMCVNLEIFHFSHVGESELWPNDAAEFSSLRNLLELDLHDTVMSAKAMLALLESLPETLRRFRHLSMIAMEHFPVVVERLFQLEELFIAASSFERPQVQDARHQFITPHVPTTTSASVDIHVHVAQ